MKPQGFSQSRPSNSKQATQPHHSNSAMRQSSVSSTEHHQQIVPGAKQHVLTPVQ